MISGLDLYKIFQLNIDMPFSGYVNTTKANRWFKDAYIKVIQNIYIERLNQQNAFDELSYLLSLNTVKTVNSGNTIYHTPIPISNITNVGTTITVTTELPHNLLVGDGFVPSAIQGGTFTILNGLSEVVATVTNSTVFTYVTATAPTLTYTAGTGVISPTNSFSDYLHYLYAEATFISPYYTLSVTASTNTTPIRITLNKRNKLRDADYVLIAGVTGNTTTNGRRYYKFLNEKLGSLYQDINLTIPISGSGTQTNTGTLSEIVTSPLKVILSDERGSIYGQPTILSPNIQQGLLQFHIYPISVPCETVKMDYIRKPPMDIDVTNSTIDYERYYPVWFLYNIANEAARYFAFSARDGNLAAGVGVEISEQS